MSMPYVRTSTSQTASLPPINILFAEVQERQVAQPSTPPVRSPSAWPGFPGPNKNALTNSGYQHASPPPPLQVGRRRSAPSPPPDVLSSPSIFPRLNSRDSHSDRSSHRTGPRQQERESSHRRASYAQPSQTRSRRESWSDSASSSAQAPQTSERDLGRLPPIVLTFRSLLFFSSDSTLVHDSQRLAPPLRARHPATLARSRVPPLYV
ncbi:hypothetical protein B0H11DRAFT_1190100 [Mycena galericulata]|nr:hypothetical protein B0H11DRAFT_1190100 [Mycena galericulata]